MFLKKKKKEEEKSDFNPYHASLCIPGQGTRYNPVTQQYEKTLYFNIEAEREKENKEKEETVLENQKLVQVELEQTEKLKNSIKERMRFDNLEKKKRRRIKTIEIK